MDRISTRKLLMSNKTMKIHLLYDRVVKKLVFNGEEIKFSCVESTMGLTSSSIKHWSTF